MLKKKNGIIMGLSLMLVTSLSGGAYAYTEVQEKQEVVESQQENLSELKTEKEALKKDKLTKEQELSKKEEELAKANKALSEKEKAIKAKEDAIKKKDKALKDKDKTIKQKDSNIDKLEKDLSAKAKRKEEELKSKKEVVVASAAPASSSVSRDNEPKEGKTFYVTATAYTALCDTGCTGITATGINLLKNPGLKVIAVDPSVIPLGSKVYVEGYGYAIAGDTGGAIKGNKIDLYMQSHSNAVAYGRQKVKITILK